MELGLSYVLGMEISADWEITCKLRSSVNEQASASYEAAIEKAGFQIIETAYYAAKTNNRFVVARKS